MNKTIESLEPTTRSFVEKINKLGGTPIYKLSPEEARKVLSNLQATTETAKLPADIEDLNLPVGPNGQVSIRIIRPKGNKENLPIVMYFHGGGWVLGNKDTHDRLVREIANGAKAAVVFVNYTLSPEAKYPRPIEEAYAATKYIADHGKDFGLDTSRLAVAGDSVGGNMVAAVLLLAKERGGPKIDHQVLFYPVTDANFDTQSYQQYATDIWLTREAMKWFWDNYLPDEKARKQPTASPLQSSTDQLSGQPPALIITDENDVLRDEGEAYAHKLVQAGVNVTAVRYLGTIHDFVMLNALAGTPATCSAVGLANEILRSFFASRS
jgi:acetyl esterase/lipase